MQLFEITEMNLSMNYLIELNVVFFNIIYGVYL